jgi:predicted metal-dependent hydrolase
MSPINHEIKIDKIYRSRRKTIAIEIKKDGSLIVRAPYLTTRAQIEEFVGSKSRWIRKKQELVRVQSQAALPRKFTTGEKYLYMGCTYDLQIVADLEEPLLLRDKFYLAKKFQSKGSIIFEDWYKKQAAEDIKTMVKERADQNGFSYSRIRITSARTRWGSCSSKGSLNFTWRLVMAPRAVIDYVVVHELVHLRIRNHSRVYWNEVSKVMPGYEQYRQWLRENGHRLTLE